MKISYGKNVYGNEEVRAVVNQLKKTTQMGASFKKIWFNGELWFIGTDISQ